MMVTVWFASLLFVLNAIFPALVHYVLNEIIIGGIVMDNSMSSILQSLEEQKKLEKNEIPVFYHESH
ncbi:hypothetical protein NPIL_304941 [Nephila pilipes]|uniref:Uncharacterized protein n=1 Tax=Nephila pilipes TaxID=299642 RepID=A0A8X6PQC2_NEPPI|nr:hypothetical protein NPIL_304941 [Nephila pilipes]